VKIANPSDPLNIPMIASRPTRYPGALSSHEPAQQSAFPERNAELDSGLISGAWAELAVHPKVN